jgi:hypothetical protein
MVLYLIPSFLSIVIWLGLLRRMRRLWDQGRIIGWRRRDSQLDHRDYFVPGPQTIGELSATPGYAARNERAGIVL